MRREFEEKSIPTPIMWSTVVFLLASAVYLVWFWQLNLQTNTLYDQSDEAFKKSQISYIQYVGLVPGQPPIQLLKSNPFRPNTRWMYVSSGHPLAQNYQPANLVTTTLPHASSESGFKLQKIAETSLEKMFKDASDAGHPLIISSAYRSVQDQQALLDQRTAEIGAEQARKYVASPGASEHETGLAVDINTFSEACENDANVCAISQSTATWLKENAPNYGFILRYPPDKEAITGISNEPWHFRYVGTGAKTLTASGLTLDEFVQKVDPSIRIR